MLPTGTILDGELWIPGMPFQKVSGILRKNVNISEHLDKLTYYLFDIDIPKAHGLFPYEMRYEMLEKAVVNYYDMMKEHKLCERIQLIDCEVLNNEQEIVEYHDKKVKEGFEGIMLRKIGSVHGIENAIYHHGYSHRLLKFKKFHEEEAKIIDVVDAKGVEKGQGLLFIKDKYGNEMRQKYGTKEERIEFLAHPEKVIGKLATLKYQEISIDNFRRFPTLKDIRDYE